MEVTTSADGVDFGRQVKKAEKKGKPFRPLASQVTSPLIPQSCVN